MSRRIEDYALLGNGETTALVSVDGSIDWLCWPRYDDEACFAALLGTSENGCWSLEPAGTTVKRERRYQEDTLVVETDVETPEGAVRIIDFMPFGDLNNSLVRMIVGLRGVVRMRTELRLRFDYGSIEPSITYADGLVQACAGPHRATLRADVRTALRSGTVAAEFDVAERETIRLVLTYGPSDDVPPSPFDVEEALRTTQRYWRGWIDNFDNDKSAWPQVVRRSLLTLKALTHRGSGAMIAAPTASLPEAPGGSLNWDYRYCWLRDTCFSLVALLNAGYHEEARARRDWLLCAIAGSPEHVRIMYRVDGGRHLGERTIDWLPGYRCATPVRVGNAAAEQKQVDVLGEVIDCLDVARHGGLPPSEQEDLIETRIVEHLETAWDTPGSGIWESRSKPRHYTYSRVMAWVAVDRFIRRRATAGALASRLEKLAELRQTIRDEIYEKAWNEDLGTFTQFYGSDEVDGSLLLMPLVGFLPADEPRVAATIDTIRRELGEGGLVRRRKRNVGGPSEGVFLPCSCWMADCLQMQGRSVEAREQFERVLALANDVGLFSEQYDAPRGELAGNFPQALTHIAIINTALGLCGRTLQRGGG